MSEYRDPASIPANISDIASMLRTRISNNERPFMKEAYEHNNDLVTEWYEKVLKKICNKKSQIKAGNAFGEWQVFYDGKTVPLFIEYLNKGLVERPSKDIVNYWVDIFERYSVTELMKIGAPLVTHGWKLVTDETFIYKCLEKWENVYSKSNDPLEWRKIAQNNPKLFNQEHDSIFWDVEQNKEITQKVMTVVRTKVSPDN